MTGLGYEREGGVHVRVRRRRSVGESLLSRNLEVEEKVGVWECVVLCNFGFHVDGSM